MPQSSTKIVPVGDKVCRPFLVEVMVFSPEAGYRFKVSVERTCTPEADAVWKLVFDLYRVAGSKETQLVHVSFTAGTPVHQRGIEHIAAEGVKPKQSDILVNEVHPATKAIVGEANPTPKQKKKIHDAMEKVVTVNV